LIGAENRFWICGIGWIMAKVKTETATVKSMVTRSSAVGEESRPFMSAFFQLHMK
jgi:hypothetical protein